jgi:DNA-binding XRE family transcriptional regulator
LVHHNFKVIRIAFGLNQEDFGKRIGVSKDTICNWERGKTKPDIGHLLTIVDMGANINYLLHGNGSPLQRMSA